MSVKEKKIDIHTHILPKDLPRFKEKYGYGGFGCLEHTGSCAGKLVRDDGTFIRNVESNLWDAHQRIQECRKFGVTTQVLSTVPFLFSYWAKANDVADMSKYLNDHIAEVIEKNPAYFLGLCTVPLQDTGLAIRELERSVKTLRFSGVQIGTNVNGRNFDDPELFEFFTACEELGAAVFVHPWDMMAPERMKKYWLPWLVGMPTEISLAICSMIFAGVFERLPGLRICFAHGGGAFAGTLGRIEKGFQARPDLCAVDNKTNPKSYAGRFFVDSLAYDERTLEFLLDVFGEDCVALGSDYPFPLGEDVPGDLIQSMKKLEENMRQKLFYRNAQTWLGITE